jgi:hypothetical protein
MARDKQSEWIQRVLGVRIGEHPKPDAEAPRHRLAAAAHEVATLKALGVPELPALLEAIEAARAGLGGPDASNQLDALDALIARAKSAERGRVAAAENRRGIAYPKLLLSWRDAQARARSAVEGMGQTLLALPEVQADPRFAQAQEAVGRLPGLIPDLGAQLADLLDQGINAGTDTAIATEALKVVGDYRRNLGAATGLSRLEAFAKKHVGDLAVLSRLESSLAQIAAGLKNAV